MEDFELARAARRVIITTEEIVGEDVVRRNPDRTVIPFYLVDAVCEVPYGAHPTQMPYLFFLTKSTSGSGSPFPERRRGRRPTLTAMSLA